MHECRHSHICPTLTSVLCNRQTLTLLSLQQRLCNKLKSIFLKLPQGYLFYPCYWDVCVCVCVKNDKFSKYKVRLWLDSGVDFNFPPILISKREIHYCSSPIFLWPLPFLFIHTIIAYLYFIYYLYILYMTFYYDSGPTRSRSHFSPVPVTWWIVKKNVLQSCDLQK